MDEAMMRLALALAEDAEALGAVEEPLEQGVFVGLVRRVAVLSGIRIIPALVRRTPAF